MTTTIATISHERAVLIRECHKLSMADSVSGPKMMALDVILAWNKATSNRLPFVLL